MLVDVNISTSISYKEQQMRGTRTGSYCRRHCKAISYKNQQSCDGICLKILSERIYPRPYLGYIKGRLFNFSGLEE